MSNPAGPDNAGPSSATDVPAVVPTTAGAAEDRGPGPASHPLVEYNLAMADICERRGAANNAAMFRKRAEYWRGREEAGLAALDEAIQAALWLL